MISGLAETLLPHRIFLLDRDQSARGRGPGDEGRHSFGLILFRRLGLLQIGRPAPFSPCGGKPADLGKPLSNLASIDALEGSQRSLKRAIAALGRVMALLLST
jgi:hypothetical protein